MLTSYWMLIEDGKSSINGQYWRPSKSWMRVGLELGWSPWHADDAGKPGQGEAGVDQEGVDQGGRCWRQGRREASRMGGHQQGWRGRRCCWRWTWRLKWGRGLRRWRYLGGGCGAGWHSGRVEESQGKRKGRCLRHRWRDPGSCKADQATTSEEGVRVLLQQPAALWEVGLQIEIMSLAKMKNLDKLFFQ